MSGNTDNGQDLYEELEDGEDMAVSDDKILDEEGPAVGA